jgi:DNA adenine methylase
MSDPFLKWAGGKRWLVANNRLPIPHGYRRYIEPFLGGDSVFFHLKPANAILSDLNEELIELYRVIRDSPMAIQALMEAHQKAHSKSHYYNVRASIPTTPNERASRMLYLNRACWNGLYRVNLKGEFNVPIGTKQSILFEGEELETFSSVLKSIELRCADFASTMAEAGEGDFVFIDPPYTVQHNLNGFVKYNERIFSWADQIRLRDAVRSAIKRGASVVITNADHASIRELYKGICDYCALERHSVLAGSAAKRGLTTEALFTSNLCPKHPKPATRGLLPAMNAVPSQEPNH